MYTQQTVNYYRRSILGLNKRLGGSGRWNTVDVIPPLVGRRTRIETNFRKP